MPTSKEHLQTMIYRAEFQIQAEERTIKKSLQRIKDLEKHMMDCKVRLQIKEMN